MKTVTALAGASQAFSTSVLTGDVTEQTRWGFGSLVANLLAKASMPLQVLITHGGQGKLLLKAFDATIPVDFSENDANLMIRRAAGTSKSRPVQIVNPMVEVTPPAVLIDSITPTTSTLDQTIVGLVSNPPSPSFSLLGVLNKLEPLIDEKTAGFALIIDQVDEEIRLYDDYAQSADIVVNSLMTHPLVASFELTLDETTETIPGYGWE